MKRLAFLSLIAALAVGSLTACGSSARRQTSGSETGAYSVAAVRAAFARQGIHIDHALGPPAGGGFALLIGRRSRPVGVAVYEGPPPQGLVRPATGRAWPFAGAQDRRDRNVFIWWNRADGGAVTAALSALH